MEKRKITKTAGIVIDVLMYVILLVQMVYVFTGNVVHEILGICFFVCLVGHIVIKRKQLLATFKKGNKSASRRVSDIVTMLLFIAIIALMVSSMGVSRTLFPWFRLAGSTDLHVYLATAVLTLAVLHGGMHGFIRTKKKKLAAALIAAGCAAAIAVGLALVPYLNRHFKTVEIDYSEAVSGEKVSWNGSKPLVVYFTRVGNTDFASDVDAVSGASLMLANGELMGNTQLLADMVSDAVGCDKEAITLTGEKYPSSYSDTVSVAGKELNSGARPGIEKIDVSGYDTVILVYPLWWGTIPMPVAAFLEDCDFSGKTIYLIATQGSSGYGSSIDDIKEMAPGADIMPVMSIYCDDIPDSRQRIGEWLRQTNE